MFTAGHAVTSMNHKMVLGRTSQEGSSWCADVGGEVMHFEATASSSDLIDRHTCLIKERRTGREL